MNKKKQIAVGALLSAAGAGLVGHAAADANNVQPRVETVTEVTAADAVVIDGEVINYDDMLLAEARTPRRPQKPPKVVYGPPQSKMYGPPGPEPTPKPHPDPTPRPAPTPPPPPPGPGLDPIDDIYGPPFPGEPIEVVYGPPPVEEREIVLKDTINDRVVVVDLEKAEHTRDKVIKIVADALKIDKDDVAPELDIVNDLHADSVALEKIAKEIEKHFKITLTVDRMATLRTVNDITYFVLIEKEPLEGKHDD